MKIFLTTRLLTIKSYAIMTLPSNKTIEYYKIPTHSTIFMKSYYFFFIEIDESCVQGQILLINIWANKDI